MIKRDAGFFPEGGDWEYVATDRDGWVADRGQLKACARCHAEAKADWVFGLPETRSNGWRRGASVLADKKITHRAEHRMGALRDGKDPSLSYEK